MVKISKILALVLITALVSSFAFANCGKPGCPKSEKSCKHGDSKCCKEMTGVTKTVVNTEKGVTLTIAAKSPEAVKAVQECLAACQKDDKCKMEGVTREVKNTEQGAVVTMMSDNAKTVKKLQKKVAKCAAGKCKCCKSSCGEKKEGCSKDSKASCSSDKKAGCSSEKKKSCGH